MKTKRQIEIDLLQEIIRQVTDGEFEEDEDCEIDGGDLVQSVMFTLRELQRQEITPPFPKPLTSEGKMQALCQSIPVLARMPQCRVWDADALAKRWPTASSGERAAIQFVLNVWNTDTKGWLEEYNIPPFTMREFSVLDDNNQAAIARWYAEPFWP